jgi:hypothetical protein
VSAEADKREKLVEPKTTEVSKREKFVEPKTTTKAINAVPTSRVIPAPTASMPVVQVETAAKPKPKESEKQQDIVTLPPPVVVPGHTPPSKELLEGMIEVLKDGEVDLTDQMTEDAILKALVFCARGVLDISDRSMSTRYLAEARAKAGRLAKLRAEQEQRIAEAKAGRLGVAAG